MESSEITQEQQREFAKRILLSRMRLLCNQGFYGLLLMHLKFALTDGVECARTDGETIELNPQFLDRLSDSELDYALMHEVLHVALRHCERRETLDSRCFDIASDIVVNSTILLSNDMDERSITLRSHGGVQPHKAPDGREGSEFSVEELCELLGGIRLDDACGEGQDESPSSGSDSSMHQADKPSQDAGESSQARLPHDAGALGNVRGWDDHAGLDDMADDQGLCDDWSRWIRDACESVSAHDALKGCSSLPLFAQRWVVEVSRSRIDWRTMLREFVQEEVNDYSFMPPDRRFDDGPFFLPDFNDTTATMKDILFMVDASGSMADEEVSAAFFEIKDALDQFDGKLRGWLGFFDAVVAEPQPFETVEDLLAIRPKGGGGTSFHAVFSYIKQHLQEMEPSVIVILTDGYASFPAEEAAQGIPVLWLIDNDEKNPPWGKVARLQLEK